MTSSSISGARESSAGDHFHVLWGVRRVLGLLDPASGLERVVIEDLTPVPPAGVPPELLLGADMTEYYGGVDLRTADRVVVSQLKYSERHPGHRWTAAALARNGSRGQKGVIARLADIYRAQPAIATRAEILDRLQIRLVSNMAAAPAIARALGHAHAWLADRPAPVRLADLFRALDAGDQAELRRLAKATGLASTSFTDFLRVLDLSHAGTGSRAEQELRVTEALSRHVLAELRYASLALTKLVYDRGLPEGEGRPIERADVLVALEVHSEDSLLPAPPRFEAPEFSVNSPDARRLAEALADAPGRRLLAHGAAGVGKTTTILGLEHELPPGSIVLTYDCFGEGAYETAGGARHLDERFGVQLCNELAIRCRLPILIRPPHSTHDLWRELERRLTAAAELLREQGAQLVVVVDAADNAAWAGKRFGEDTFLKWLWVQPISDGAALVVTCRSGRRDTVGVPDEVRQVELSGFDETASAEYLRSRFLDATDDQALAFHENSKGNPRVQFYVLFENRADSAETVEEAVAQANLLPRDIFKSLLDAAVSQAPDVEAAREHMAELVCLTKPLTTGRFRRVSGMAAARVAAFCSSLEPGVVVDGPEIAFRDEDFASFLRDEVGQDEERAAHGRLADLFLDQQAGDAYAATVVADHLHQAARSSDLITLALEAGAPDAIEDPLARQQAYRRRLTLALRHTANVEDRAAACRLVILAGEAARQNQAVAHILRKRPDLGMRYSDPEAVMRVYGTSEEADWAGPVHMQLAAFYARSGDDARARTEGRLAEAWLVRRQEVEDRWPIDADDVAAYAETFFHLFGADAAEDQIRAWRPRSFALAAGVALARRLARTLPGEQLTTLIAGRDLPALVRARLLAAVAGEGAIARPAAVRAVAAEILEDPPGLDEADGWWAATFAELAAYVGVSKREVLRLTKAFRLPQAAYAPHRYERLGRYRDRVRLAALSAVCRHREPELEALMPASVTDPPDGHRRRDVDSERRDMQENVGRYLEVFSSRARALLVKPPVAELRAEWERSLGARAQEARRYRREPDYGYRVRVAALTDAVLVSQGTDAELVALMADAATDIAGAGAYVCWVTAATRLVHDARYREQGLRLLERAAQAVESAERPASEQADALLDACAIADRVDQAHAQDLHARAIQAAEGMDDEAIGRLEVHARLAGSAAGTSFAAALAWRTAEVLVAHRRRVSDEDHLPWRETLKACTELHPPTGLTLVARWEDDCHLSLETTVPVVALPLAATGFLEPAQALALLDLAGEQVSNIAVATDLLERLPVGPERTAALDDLSLRVRRDLLPGARTGAAAALIEWAGEHGLGQHEAVTAIAPYCAPRASGDEYASYARRASGEWGQGESEWEQRERQADAILDRATDADPARVDGDLAELARLYGAHRIPEYLRRVADALVPSRRMAFVDVLGSLGPTNPVMELHSDDVLEALVRAAREWTRSRALDSRIADAITRVVEVNFESLVRYRGVAENTVAEVLTVEALDDAQAIVLRVVGASLERLDAASLFGIASELGAALDLDERTAVLDWSLAGMEAEPTAPPEVPSSAGDVLGGVLWSLLGAPDKAIRWRAAHVARRLIVAGDDELLRKLLDDVQNTRTATPFSSDRLAFHWLAAQTWAAMVIARIARDAPGAVALSASALADGALSREWPHASIREFARRAVLRVADGVPDALSDDLVGRVELANMPLLYKRERTDRFYRTGSGNREYDTERFHFDSMDTVPYVYGPFGERFGFAVDAVCERAERWIVDELGLGEDREFDPRLERLDYSLRDNHHSTSPRGESWHQMLEEHALLLVAGELCDQGAAIEAERGDEPDDPWTSWLESWTDAMEHAWIADERDPVPPVPALLLQDIGREWPELTESELHRAIGIDDPETLIVDASVEFSPGFGWGWTYVTSALVSPETAPALVHALDSAEDPRAFALPQERGRWSDEQYDIDSGEFRLQGWIWDEFGRDLGLEDHDPLRRIGLDVTRPGTLFLELMGASLERGGRVVRDTGGRAVAWQRAWSDIERGARSERESEGTKGFETVVRRDALRELLRNTESLLILKAWGSRSKSGDDYGDPTERRERHEQTIHRVYLFDPDRGFLG